MKRPNGKAFMKLAAPVAALVFLGSLASCGEITTTPLNGGDNAVYGTVTTKDKPLADVRVIGGTETVTTGADGKYRTYVPKGDGTLTFTKDGYEDVTMPVSAGSRSEIKIDVAMTPGTSGGGAGAGFTVTPGAYQRAQVTGPGRMSFTVVGIDMDLDKDAWPIVYFYDSKGYTGGKGGSGGFNGELRTYKLKFYDANGVIASESYYIQPKGNTPRWDPSVARNVTLEWGSDFVQSSVDGIPFRKPGSVARTFTIGIGYPPAVRPGWDRAVYTNIVWPAGAVRVD